MDANHTIKVADRTPEHLRLNIWEVFELFEPLRKKPSDRQRVLIFRIHAITHKPAGLAQYLHEHTRAGAAGSKRSRAAAARPLKAPAHDAEMAMRERRDKCAPRFAGHENADGCRSSPEVAIIPVRCADVS